MRRPYSKAPPTDRSGRSPIHCAAIESSIQDLARLLREGVDPNAQDKDGWTALHFAAQAQSAEVAKHLLEAGAHVDIQDHHGNTPLLRAVFSYRGDGSVIQALRAAGANPLLVNKYEVSPLSLARTIANTDVAVHFLDLSDDDEAE